MTVIVRVAEDHDAEPVLLLLKRMHAENGLASLNWNKVVERAREVFEVGIPLVADIDGDVVGSLGLLPGQWWYSDDWYLGESWVYVRPDARKTRAAAMLVERAQKAAKDADLPLYIGLITTTDLDVKTRFFNRFLKPVGVVFQGG